MDRPIEVYFCPKCAKTNGDIILNKRNVWVCSDCRIAVKVPKAPEENYDYVKREQNIIHAIKNTGDNHDELIAFCKKYGKDILKPRNTEYEIKIIDDYNPETFIVLIVGYKLLHIHKGEYLCYNPHTLEGECLTEKEFAEKYRECL